MKTPDKIYVAISKFMCPGLASCSKLKDDMTEYIRKDALLELIEKTAIFYKEKIQEGEPWSEIRLEVCEHLISKINKI